MGDDVSSERLSRLDRTLCAAIALSELKVDNNHRFKLWIMVPYGCEVSSSIKPKAVASVSSIAPGAYLEWWHRTPDKSWSADSLSPLRLLACGIKSPLRKEDNAPSRSPHRDVLWRLNVWVSSSEGPAGGHWCTS